MYEPRITVIQQLSSLSYCLALALSIPKAKSHKKPVNEPRWIQDTLFQEGWPVSSQAMEDQVNACILFVRYEQNHAGDILLDDAFQLQTLSLLQEEMI